MGGAMAPMAPPWIRHCCGLSSPSKYHARHLRLRIYSMDSMTSLQRTYLGNTLMSNSICCCLT